nr:unnamed protein product [Digitaria exilis]
MNGETILRWFELIASLICSNWRGEGPLEVGPSFFEWLAWLLAKNKTTFIPIISAVLRAMLYSVHSTESGTSSNSPLLAVDSLQFEHIGSMSSTVGKSSTPQVFHVVLLGLELCLMMGSRDAFL